ncbi:hypothetical protein [Paucibacter sp. DJ2R-2]|uniref:hypothetical protein n=1 Tax=Paucibacter sp. DJ2R-2 TaxID=2893558 RepID=UPI0021E3B8F6|nr:hypothetical protein [Paucibacter sp. DJ2R-2]MCV2439266.1 hypothetical protein [Paucibacter sp. DJ2R-2]
MKVFDRYDGIEVELPDIVEPGRFRLMQPVVLNGCIEVAKGEVLWSDGSSRCALAGHGLTAQPPLVFKQPSMEQDPERPDGVIDHALRDVVRQIDGAGHGVLPSPVMPAQLDEMAELHKLERMLRETLDTGHLDHIARRPRMDMRYDAEVLPVSRAKRLAPDMLTRLASHSEDWHRRDITGVVPSRLKAEVSEDELAIYENVVFVRLLEQLRKWLDRRVTDLMSLEASHDAAKGLQEADRLHYRLRNALCALWGRSFEDQQSAGQLVTQTRQVLQSLLGRVRQLLCSDVAKAVPMTRQIPMMLRDTNILRHDPHYLHLRPLWLLAHAADSAGGASPTQRFEEERQRGERHRRYVELLLRHALGEIRLLAPNADGSWSFGPWKLSAKQSGDEWVLALDTHEQRGPALLWLVPGMRGHRDWSQQKPDRLVVFCMPERRRGDEDQCGGDSVLNPMEFYGVERVRFAVESWLLSQLARQWPFKVEPVPTGLALALQEAGEGTIVSQGRSMLILAGSASRKLKEATLDASTATADTKRALVNALELAKLIGTCRLCSSEVPGQNIRSSSLGYKATCNCGHEWTLSRQSGSNCEAQFGLSDSPRPFAEIGSLKLSLRG